MSEKEVFVQDVSDEEMEAVAGGEGENGESCTTNDTRDIYHPSFPNCAATVEYDSWCDTNDACRKYDVVYQNMTDCHRAWT